MGGKDKQDFDDRQLTQQAPHLPLRNTSITSVVKLSELRFMGGKDKQDFDEKHLTRQASRLTLRNNSFTSVVKKAGGI